MKYLLTGGTGLIGSRLVPELLNAGHEVIVLTRKAKASGHPNLRYVAWNGKEIDPQLGPVDVVINLAGAGVADHKWTAAYKKEILDSRVNATSACVKFIQAQTTKPKVFVSASAVGYYGTQQSGVLDETAPAGNDFLAYTGMAWEQAAQGAGVRTVILRTGVVMAHEGGAFPKLLAPFKLYAGGYLGDGKQGLPWIHITDVLRIIHFVIEQEAIEGPVNLAAPEQLSNRDWARVMGKALNRGSGLPVPAFSVKLLMGESAVIVLEGAFIRPAKLLAAGFQFTYPTAAEAVKELLAHGG